MKTASLSLTFATTGALSLLVAASALAQAPDPAMHPFIVGGRPVVDISEVPWQVALVQGSGGSLFQFCGGSLIAPNWVITAAHCVDNFMVQKDPKRLDVIAGTVTYNMGGVRTEVEKLFVHPRWGQTGTQYDFDATLLKLKTPVSVVAPIKLMSSSGTLPDGLSVRVSGWGAISEGGPVSATLRLVDVPVISNAECNKPESYNNLVSAQMFCAGDREGGKDSCQGDSGGPVMSAASGTKELAGIVSWGFGCARRLMPGVYTRVSTVAQWAAETMAGN
jgi:secreted trypsin-like serine protease